MRLEEHRIPRVPVRRLLASCCRLVASIALLGCAVWPAHAGTEPVPERTAIEDARRKIREVLYPREYARSGSQARRELAQRLLAETGDFTGTSAELYALLDEARILAARSGDTTTAFTAIDGMNERFVIDLPAEQLAALQVLFENAAKHDREAAVQKGLELLFEFLTALDTSRAKPLMDGLRVHVGKCGDRSLRYRYEALSSQYEECCQAESALDFLKQHPDDREANGRAGRYLCFRAGDAERGLPLLVLGSGDPLSTVAARDISSPETCTEKLLLAEAWLDLYEEADVVEADFFLARAIFWCESVSGQVNGLDEIKFKDLEGRIEARQASEQLEGQRPTEGQPRNASAPVAVKPPKRSALSWCAVIAERPDPDVVTDTDVRRVIEASNLPWRIRHTRSGIEMVLVPVGGGQLLYVGVYEVQQAEWEHVLRGKPLSKKRTPPAMDHPWNEVLEFIDVAGDGVRLPSEAEWESLCMAGATGEADLEDVAWHAKNSGDRGHIVGGKAHNAVGVYDMLGNAFEWCDNKIARGGSWRHPPEHSTIEYRQPTRGGKTEPPGPGVGFRVVRDAP